MPSSGADPCSLSNISDFVVTHLDWTINVDFENLVFHCSAKQHVKCSRDTLSALILDSSKLEIESVEIGEEHVNYEVLPEVSPFGSPLHIYVKESLKRKGCEFDVLIRYKTSPEASALQWLSPEQTLGGKHPYLFTQCQAIHARSLVPCQDSPGHKITYTAEVTVDQNLVALMSAVKGDEVDNGNNTKTCHFTQSTPMPSYLLAIAVGALESRRVGPRSKVWSEQKMIEACEYEFADVEKMLQAGESLMGPYVWGDYDLLILPPSFPYGGMENPCLTFATPTVVAGDRSLTSLVAHEITHSWTGNLVTNRNWEHFWLNEGFTRFLEGKIVGLLEGEKMRQFAAIGGWYALCDAIEKFGATNPLTALVPTLREIDPDDAFSSVPYEKGYAFLYYIESLVGGPDVFNPFLRSYIDHFKFKTVVTEEFKEYLYSYFKEKSALLDQKIDWVLWLKAPGMPPVNVVDMYDTSLADACKALCQRWVTATENEFSAFYPNDFSSFTTAQKIDFLTKLYQEKPLSLKHMQRMVETYDLLSYNNAEIKFSILRLCIRVEWTEVYDDLVKFLVSQGRMKFVRPLYREMAKYSSLRDLAVKTFTENRHIYHKIASNMIAKDLNVS